MRDLIPELMSLINKRNMSGPKTVPRGTPHVTPTDLDRQNATFLSF